MVYAGTSGWAYASWKPEFYPAGLASTKFLDYYSRRLSAVEVNYTFRRFPTAKVLQNWLDQTPEGFQFAVKAHQRITHFAGLRGVEAFTHDFLQALEPLRVAKRLGPVLFQLPPSFQRDLVVLREFLAALPPVRAAFEFRHPSWFVEEVYGLLRRANVAFCQAESERLKSPSVQTADYSYLRLRKEDYSDADRRRLAREVARLLKKGDVYAFFKHEDTAAGALDAEKLLCGQRRQVPAR